VRVWRYTENSGSELKIELSTFQLDLRHVMYGGVRAEVVACALRDRLRWHSSVVRQTF